MRLFKYAWLVVALLWSCGTSKNSGVDNTSNPISETSKYGGLMRINYSQRPENFFPLSITSTVGSQIASQVYEGLFKMNPVDLSIEPCLAQSWSWSEDRKTLTVLLKEGIYFHQNECFKEEKTRALVASDVVFSFTQMATPSSLNNSFQLIEENIAGAKEYYQAQLDGRYEVVFTGVESSSRYEVIFHLNEPNSMFLNFLSRVEASIFPQEAFDFHGLKLRENMVGTGPFIQSSLSYSE